MKSAITKTAAGLVYYSNALKLLHIKADSNVQYPFLVLLYHRVNSNNDPLFPGLSVPAFDAQMAFLSRHYKVMPLVEIFGRVREGKPIEPWSVAVTFDDGYRDNYSCAHPILKKYGLSATLFVSTGYIETGQVLWNDRVSWAVKQTKRKDIEFKSNNGSEVLPLQETEQRVRALDRILESLKSLPEVEKQARVESLLGELGGTAHAPEPLMLTWNELRRMQEEGWGIGSHTVSHPILSRIDQTQVRQELQNSKHALESHLQIPIEFLAYPNGKRTDFSPAVKVLARECGFQGAVTTLGGFNAEPLDLFEVGRQSPWDDHLARFAVKLSWPFWRAMSASRSAARSDLKINERIS